MELVAGQMCSGSGAAQPLQPGEEALRAGGNLCARERAVNTDEDWEQQIRTMLESETSLSRDFNQVQEQLKQEQLDFNKKISDVRKKRDQSVREHQALLEKLESVRVKLQLNNSKAMRKNFLSKIKEVTSQRSQAQDERDRLSAELSEADLRLSSLQQEQEEERRSWENDLADLRAQTERAQNEARAATAKAEGDLRNALETQREKSDSMVQTWVKQVGVYLAELRVELPHRFRQEKPQWERREAAVRRDQAELHKQIQHLLQQLDRHQLHTLPPLKLPALPQVPMAELYVHRIMQAVTRGPPPPPLVMAPPPAIVNPRHHLLPTPRPPYPRQHFPHPPIMVVAPPRLPVMSRPVQNPPTIQQVPPFQQQVPPIRQAPPPLQPTTPTPQPDPPTSEKNTLPQEKVPPPQQQAPPPQPKSPPTPNKAPPPQQRASRGAPTPPPSSTPPVPVPAAAPPQATAPPTVAMGKLQLVLEKLSVHFPRCSREQLTLFLQQVKSERGTLAGLSLEEVVEAIRQKAVPQKPCLMCQKAVDVSDRFELSCSHIVHSDCIKVWLQSNPSHNCPFCPST